MFGKPNIFGFSNSQSSVAPWLQMKWKYLWYIIENFYESPGERILKIGLHLQKLLSNINGLTFWDIVYMYDCVC